MPIDLRKAKVTNSKREDEEKVLQQKKDEFESSKTEKEAVKRVLSWKAPEYEAYEKSTLWYLVAGLVILGIVVYAMFTNSPIMAITFILIGVVGYLHLQRSPNEIEFVINYEGVRAGRELYEYDNIKSFWIFYDPPHTKTLSLHTNASMVPFVHVPIADNDPVEIREILLDFIPEVKQDPSMVDSLSRFLHI